MDFDVLREDLRFLRTKFKRPLVAWHDPNFGVRFDDYLDMIEDAVPPGSVDLAAESSLSLLSEPHLKRLKRNGFQAVLPGIESWFGLGGKSKTGALQGMDKFRHVAEHVNLILKYIPYIQTNFVMGLDSDEGAEPFELTKRFLDLAPGAFPAYSLLTAFGQAGIPVTRDCSELRIWRTPSPASVRRPLGNGDGISSSFTGSIPVLRFMADRAGRRNPGGKAAFSGSGPIRFSATR